MKHLSLCGVCTARSAEASPSDPLTEWLIQAASGTDIGFVIDESLADVVPPAALGSHARYRVLRLLGHGGMGDVWLAEHLVMRRLVALKIFRPGLLRKPAAVEQFRKEVHASAQLHHPNIVIAYDAEQIGDVHVLVMEFVDGPTLAQEMKLLELSVAEACRAVLDAARGLEHAHVAGLVHRDVKPRNLLRTQSGLVKVVDFGLVFDRDSEGTADEQKFLMGTPDYIAPEQAENPRLADARSDIYSLGITLYHLLSRRVHFSASDVNQKIAAHHSQLLEPIETLPPGL